MKTTRREFVKRSALGLAAVPMVHRASAQVGVPSGPLVLSTWDFGLKANEAAWAILSKEGYALDAVEAGVKVVEADPEERSVGYGGRPDRDGRVTLDACIMDENLHCGSVGCLEHIMHPISVARAVMEKSPHVMLVGDGAYQFAQAQGFPKTNMLTPASEAEWKEWLKTSQYKPVINIENHDTIGMLAMDAQGRIAGACTTSGMAFKMHGRLGDSPIIGAGLYVDGEIGGATATGHGEEVIRIAGCHLVVELMRQGRTPDEACREAVERVYRRQKHRLSEIQVGFIAMRNDGLYGAFALQKGFSYAVRNGANQALLQSAAKV